MVDAESTKGRDAKRTTGIATAVGAGIGAIAGGSWAPPSALAPAQPPESAPTWRRAARPRLFPLRR